jgi:valyl-tRNA synthetase
MEKKYDHQINEPRIKAFWHENATYTLAPEQLDDRPLFSVDTPPPTVSGSLHIGHIFSYTHTDLIARYKRMSGYAVFYPFGFDDNGLPTERFVEKKRGITAFSVGRSEFIKLCLAETVEVEKKFQDLWQTIGLSIDWNHWYSTIDARTRTISQQSFIELYSKKYVYRKQEPALYCTTCYTSVAQAELDDAEKETLFTTIAFTGADGSVLPIATTRPEFLGACLAVLYNPEDARYKHLAGTTATVPLYGFTVPLLPEETVKIDKGTGLVMCCSFGDTTDIEWIKKLNLPIKPILQKDGRFQTDLEYIGGLKVKPAREKILAELAAQNLIIEQKKLVHNVNIHERCKNEIEFLSLPQWFIDIKSHKEEFLAMGRQVEWHPEYMKSRYDNWVEHINWDWCISRQRFFGIPFPCWHCTTCNTVIFAEESQLPIDPQETAYHKPCPNCNSTEIVPDMDVMDTWNTSSLTPQIAAQMFKKAYPKTHKTLLPMSMRPQAHDIIRTWAFDTIVKSWMHDKHIPWHDIVISGHVQTTDKQKISKSQGNSPLEPENLLKTYPADVIRYWTAGAQLGTDTAFSENQFKIGQRLIVKLWNACLFIKEHGTPLTLRRAQDERGEAARGEPFGEAQDKLRRIHLSGLVIPQDTVNKWILHQATATFTAYKQAFDDYLFHKALEVVEKFFWNDFCDNYLELVKDQFFNPGNYSPELIAETQAVLYKVGFELIQWYAPFLPYITENIYQELYKDSVNVTSLHQTTYSSEHDHYDYPHEVKVVELLLQAVQQVRKIKTDAAVSLKTDIKLLTIHCSAEQQKQLATVEKILAGVARSQQIQYTTAELEQEVSLIDNQGIYSMVIDL